VKINFKNIRVLGYLTLFGFGLLGLGLLYFTRKEGAIDFFRGNYPLSIQILTGLIYGFVSGYAAWFIVVQDFMNPVREKYGKVIQGMKLSLVDIWFLSFCAGVGEELFFRGGLQPLLGIWITAVLFVAIHGYLNPWNWRISIYGIVLCFFIAGLGYLTEEVGILSAVIAHVMIDVILLKKLTTTSVYSEI
jgi:uncharacterized protein